MYIPIKAGKTASHAACANPKNKQTKRAKQRGLTLIELIVFIVIVGVSVAGVIVTYSTVVDQSADPVVRKQALAIADSLLLEIEQMGFTYCDVSDANFLTAADATKCANNANSQSTPGPVPAGSTRGSWDNVGDYHGYSAGTVGDAIDGVPDINGNNTIPGYRAEVSVAPAPTAPATALTTIGLPGGAVGGDTLRITVTVTGPGNIRVALVGYRMRYAPNSP